MAWQLATLRHGLQAQLIPLPVIQPTAESDVAQMAQQAQQAIQAVITAKESGS